MFNTVGTERDGFCSGVGSCKPVPVPPSAPGQTVPTVSVSGSSSAPPLSWLCEIQARKNSTKIDFLGPETAWWGGGLPRTGVGWPKSSCPPSKVCLPWVLKGGIWDVLGILPGCPGPLQMFKKFVQKSVCAKESSYAFFVPYLSAI